MKGIFTYPAIVNSFRRNTKLAFTKPNNYRRRYRKHFKRFNKRKLFRRNKFKTRNYEIKYSNVIENNFIHMETVQGSSSNLTNRSIFEPMISKSWPNTGTGKQQMIGNKIFIRKLVLRYFFTNTNTDNSEGQNVARIIKCKQINSPSTHTTSYSYGGLTFPEMCNNQRFYPKIGLEQGLGKIIYQRNIRAPLINSLASTWLTPTEIQTRVFKKVIKINKPYEKNAFNNANTFNFAEYYADFMSPPGPQISGLGPTVSFNYYFTFTDI